MLVGSSLLQSIPIGMGGSHRMMGLYLFFHQNQNNKYCRLSKDDDLQGESASISNQRELLTSVCKAQGWDVVDVYQDDGFTGLNMDRPGLQSLLADAKKGKINLVITKDLSRLGRNYLQTGHLIEDFFPRHGVRYIALNDNIDTLVDSNEIAPFKNVLNESFR